MQFTMKTKKQSDMFCLPFKVLHRLSVLYH